MKHIFLSILCFVLAMSCLAVDVNHAMNAQVPGVTRFNMGRYTLFVFEDSKYIMPAEDFINLPQGKKNAAFKTSNNVFFILTPSKRLMMFDAGLGELTVKGMSRGTLLEKMKAMKFDADDVRDIFISHVHADHVGGLLDAHKTPVFRRAVVHISEREVLACAVGGNVNQHLWRDVAAAYQAQLRPFKIGKYDLQVHDEKVMAVNTVGHSAGHMAYQFGNLVIGGATIHQPALQVANPDVNTVLDASDLPGQQSKGGTLAGQSLAAIQAIKSRKIVLQKAQDSHGVVACNHIPFPGLIAIKAGKNGFQFAAYKDEQKLLAAP